MVEKLDLSSFLLGFANQPILYCPNPGNAGDALIAHATYQIFDQLGLRYTVIDSNVPIELTTGQVVIYGGGGNLVEPYANAKDFIKKHHKMAARLVILPHTILSYPNLLDEFGSNVDIFCRELESYQYVTKHHGQASFYLSDDVALSMNVELTLNQGESRFLPSISSSRMAKRNLKRILRVLHHTLKNVKHRKTLYAFRDDVEKTNIEIPDANIDISQVFCGDGISEYQAHETTYRVLKFIDKFNVVYTNRLHVGISALLLGKQVYFYDNSYGKNSFVYENSLKKRFKKLLWKADSLALLLVLSWLHNKLVVYFGDDLFFLI